jgi:hypothetical protein
MVKQAGKDEAVGVGKRGLADLAFKASSWCRSDRISRSLCRSLIGSRRSSVTAIVAAK